jgi:hypothetical protein
VHTPDDLQQRVHAAHHHLGHLVTKALQKRGLGEGGEEGRGGSDRCAQVTNDSSSCRRCCCLRRCPRPLTLLRRSDGPNRTSVYCSWIALQATAMSFQRFYDRMISSASAGQHHCMPRRPSLWGPDSPRPSRRTRPQQTASGTPCPWPPCRAAHPGTWRRCLSRSR